METEIIHSDAMHRIAAALFGVALLHTFGWKAALTVIANAPNPAGVALLRASFPDASIGTVGLLLGALLPTAVAAAFFLIL